MQILDRIVQKLSNGYWHEVSEIAEEFNLNGPKLKASLEFLKDYGFIHLSKGCVKLTDATREFMRHDT